jgi:tetratricopeptide (TPR) repeat protein
VLRRFPIVVAALLAAFFCIGAAAAQKVGTLLAQGQSELDAGRLDRAEDLFRQAIDQDPESSLAHTRLGGIALLRRDYSHAIERFQRALLLKGNNSGAFIGMALGYLHLGQYALARAALKEAERLDGSRKQEIDQLLAWIDQRSPAQPH